MNKHMQNVSFQIVLFFLALQFFQSFLAGIHHAIEVCLQLKLLVSKVLLNQGELLKLFN